MVNLNLLIENVVFNRNPNPDHYGNCPTCGYDGCYGSVPRYDSDIAASFELFDIAREAGLSPSLEWDGTEWMCELDIDDSHGYVAVHVSPSMAICYAILRWKNIEPHDDPTLWASYF